MKLATAFSKAKREKDGLKSYCSDCGSAMRRSWYLRNAESEIAKAAEWQKANPEKKKQIAKATYYKNHASRRARGKAAYESGKVQTLEASRIKYAEDAAYREKKKATSRKRYDSNPGAVKVYAKQYRKSNPEKATMWVNSYRSREKRADGECSPQEWAAILEEFGHCCAYCLRHESVVGKLSVDHMDPLSRGGTNEPENLVPACRPCNSSKSSKNLLEFLAYKSKRLTAA